MVAFVTSFKKSKTIFVLASTGIFSEALILMKIYGICSTFSPASNMGIRPTCMRLGFSMIWSTVTKYNITKRTIHTLPYLKCIRLVSVRSSLLSINIAGVRIQLPNISLSAYLAILLLSPNQRCGAQDT